MEKPFKFGPPGSGRDFASSAWSQNNCAIKPSPNITKSKKEESK
jgi:hypothetical protein